MPELESRFESGHVTLPSPAGRLRYPWAILAHSNVEGNPLKHPMGAGRVVASGAQRE